MTSLASSAASETQVELLAHPYPYRAALTINADTHSVPVDHFERVHRLINGTDVIPRDSDTWSALFADPAIAADPRWEAGVRGFGLPIADSFYLFDAQLGPFTGIDPVNGRRVPNRAGGIDRRVRLDRWFRNGWIDTLHACGTTGADRAAMRAGLQWLVEAPSRRTWVVSNHAFVSTPCGIEPDAQSALEVTTKNVAKLPLWLLSNLGLREMTARWAANPVPMPYPSHQRMALWGFDLAALTLFGMAVFSLVRGHRRVGLCAVVGVIGVCVWMSRTPLAYSAGDNPETPWYSADLQAQVGVRFHAFIHPRSYPRPPGGDALALPVGPWPGSSGRPSILQVVGLDDGSEVLAYPRTGFGRNGHRTLEALTADRLRALIDAEGTAILWTHWASDSGRVFSAAGLAGLERVRALRDADELWVAPTSVLLRFAEVHATVDYVVHSASPGRAAEIEIRGLRSRDGILSAVTIDELAGLSFRVLQGPEVGVRLLGHRVPEAWIDRLRRDGGGEIVRLRRTAKPLGHST